MNGSKPLNRDAVLRLRKAVVTRAADADDLVERALRNPLGSASSIQELHDLLLFMEAYPASTAQYRSAVKSMRRLRTRLDVRLKDDRRLRDQLRDTGMHGCDMVGLYSFGLASWLSRHWPGRIELHGADAERQAAMTSLLPMLSMAEREALEQLDCDADGLLRSAFGVDPSDRFHGLIRTIAAHPMDHGLKEASFSNLQPYLRLVGDERSPSLSTLRMSLVEPFHHDGALERSVDSPRIIAQPIGDALPLSPAKRRQLINKGRMVLALMQRETDPITYAGKAEAFDMGRGLVITLYHMDARHRLALEGYAGFMAFKNGVPLAYGGAWLFPGRSKVGINVFPALRGGESAWFFAQLLRLYRQRFDVRVFEAENYQLGHGNADGLRSGAYWFYYRLGFRPWNEPLTRIAERESERVRAGKQVRIATLKRLVADGLVLRLADEPAPLIETGNLLSRALRHLARQGTEGRQRTVAAMRSRLCAALGMERAEMRTMELRLAVDAWAPLCDMIVDLNAWPRQEHHRIASALRSRAMGDERAHQAMLRRCTQLLKAWAALAERVD